MSRPIDVMIVGAQKSGTTSLLRYLGEHPECISHPQKEFAYFLDPTEYNNNYSNAFNKYFTNQEISNHSKIVAKSAGLYSDENAIRKLYEHNPDCKLILLLRNPVERTYSSYLMEKNYGSVKFEFSSIPELINNFKNENEDWGYRFFIDYGLYAKHLKNIYKYFPQKQVKIILNCDFKKDSLKICKEVYNFIQVDSAFSPNIDVKHNVTQKTRSKFYAKAVMKILRRDGGIRKILKKLIPENKAYKYGELLRNVNKTHKEHNEIDQLTKKFLIDFYKPHNDELAKLTGLELSHWNKVSSTKTPTYSFIAINNCNMCGATPNKHKVLGRRLNQSQGRNPKKKVGITTTIMKCKQCELIFSNPLPIPSSIQDHYGILPEEYWSDQYFNLSENYFREELDTLKKIVPNPSENPKYLDIGSGIGKSMIALSNAGYESYGLEPSEPFYKRAIEKMGIPSNKLTLGSIEEANYPENYFDFISFGAVLEHLYDPASSIEKAMKWAKPNGIIHIEVPSSKWLVSKLINAYYFVTFSNYVCNLSPMHSPFHLHEFGLKSFIEHSKKNNYDIVYSNYTVCQTYLPKFLDYIIKPYMKMTNTGMQLTLWLQKKTLD